MYLCLTQISRNVFAGRKGKAISRSWLHRYTRVFLRGVYIRLCRQAASRRGMSVGCDGENFSSPKEYEANGEVIRCSQLREIAFPLRPANTFREICVRPKIV